MNTTTSETPASDPRQKKPIDALLAWAQAAMGQGAARMSISVPRGWKRPEGSPRGELLCVTADGTRTFSVAARNVWSWAKKNGAK